MAKWLWHFTATAIFFTAAISSANGPQTELLTFSELQRLSPAERVRYIKEVRDLLIELSVSRDGRFSDSDPVALRPKLKVWLDFANELASEAKAESVDSVEAPIEKNERCASSPDCVAAAKLCYGLGQKLYWDTQHFDCTESLPQIFLKSPGSTDLDKFDLFITKLPNPRIKPVEAMKMQLKSTNFSSVTDESSRTSGSVSNTPALAGYGARDIGDFVHIGIERNNPVVRCRSKHQFMNFPQTTSWPECTEAQELEIAAAYKKVQPPPAVLRPVVSLADNPPPAAIIIRENQPPESTQAAVDTSSTTPETPPRANRLKGPPGIEKRVTAAEIQAALSEGKEQNSVCSKGYSLHGVFKEGEENEFYCMTDAAAAKIERAKSKPIKSARNIRCDVPRTTCGDPSKDREHIFQGKLPCVIAGMISQLDSRNRRCQPVMSSGDLKCSDQGQSICNPLLFGIRHDGLPVCVGRGQSVTKQCAELSSTLDVNRYLTSAPAGIQERWDEFKRGLGSLCQSGTVQARFHCSECNIMRQRLAEIHARYGFGCNADSSATGDELVRSSKSPRRSQKRAVSK